MDIQFVAKRSEIITLPSRLDGGGGRKRERTLDAREERVTAEIAVRDD